MEKLELTEKFFNDEAPRIGLFWFSQDYTKIIKIEGELKISDDDLLTNGARSRPCLHGHDRASEDIEGRSPLTNPGRLDPIGVHAEFDMPKDVPRGRVNYENKLFRIWVGEDCLMEDEKLITMIKSYFNLHKIDSSSFAVKRHYHWNTKT